MASNRSQIFLAREEFLMSKLNQCASDLYDPISNEKGYINKREDKRFLSQEEIKDWINTPGNFEHKSEWQHYTALDGHSTVRDVVAQFLTANLCTPEPIVAENLR